MDTQRNEDATPEKHKNISIIVNGREREFTGKQITFAEVVKLAFENPPYGANTIFTITYKRGHGNKPEGTMVEGDTVKVKKDMIFNVSATDRS